MSFLKWLLWTGCAVALGIYLASGDIGGRTPLQHLQRAWKQYVQPTKVDRVKDGIHELYLDARDKVTGASSGPPRETIRPEDREAVNRIIAQQK
jgi:hypothetical protein